MKISHCEACWYWAFDECSHPERVTEGGLAELVDDGSCNKFIHYEDGFRRSVGKELRRIKSQSEQKNDTDGKEHST